MDPVQVAINAFVNAIQAAQALPEIPAAPQAVLTAFLGQDVNLLFQGATATGELQFTLPSGQTVTAKGDFPFPEGTQLLVRVAGTPDGLRLQTLQTLPPSPPAILAPLAQGEAQVLQARLTQPNPPPELEPLVQLFRLLGGALPQEAAPAQAPAGAPQQAQAAPQGQGAPQPQAPQGQGAPQPQAPQGQGAPQLQAPQGQAPQPQQVPQGQTAPQPLTQGPLASQPQAVPQGQGAPQVLETPLPQVTAPPPGTLQPQATPQPMPLAPDAAPVPAQPLIPGAPAPVPDAPALAATEIATLLQSRPEAGALPAPDALVTLLRDLPEPQAQALRNALRSDRPAPDPQAIQDALLRIQGSLARHAEIPPAQGDALVQLVRTLVRTPEPARATATQASQAPAQAAQAAAAAPESWESWIKASVKALSDPAVSPREAPFHAAQAKEGTAFYELPLPWSPQAPLQMWVERDRPDKGKSAKEGGTTRVLLGLSFSQLGETRLGIAKGPEGLQVRVWAQHTEALVRAQDSMEEELRTLGTPVDLKILPLDPDRAVPSLRSIAVGSTFQVLG